MSIVVLGQELNKKNQNVVVKLADTIAETPVLPFFLKNYAELIEHGHAHSVMAGTNMSKAIYLEIDNKVVAHIVFDILKDVYSTAWIVFSCVDKDYRNLGLYKIMHKYFEAHSKKIGATKIASFVHLNNKPRQASCESVGMKPVFYRMEKSI
jgi:ribosomal protein S18 acetylase RimI-like enzyme